MIRMWATPLCEAPQNPVISAAQSKHSYNHCIHCTLLRIPVQMYHRASQVVDLADNSEQLHTCIVVLVVLRYSSHKVNGKTSCVCVQISMQPIFTFISTR